MQAAIQTAGAALDPTVVSLAFGAAIGVSAMLVVWVLGRAVAEVPDQDRTYLDRPPLGFRLAWWPIQWIAFYLGRLLPVSTRQAIVVRLRKAGLDYTLSPEQYVAGRLIAAACAGALAAWLAESFRQPPTGVAVAAALFAFFYPAIWLKDRIDARKRLLLKQLPFYLDIITLCVEAGLNLTGAFDQSMRRGPAGPLRDELARILRDVRAGKSRTDALRTFADRMNEPAVTSLVSALIQAESMGMNLGPILRAQAEQRRTERFTRAEKLAMEAPVKMLFPLIAFIFPCTFVVIAFPIVMKFLASGL
jgi:tight adherence protein C